MKYMSTRESTKTLKGMNCQSKCHSNERHYLKYAVHELQTIVWNWGYMNIA